MRGDISRAGLWTFDEFSTEHVLIIANFTTKAENETQPQLHGSPPLEFPDTAYP